jgi:hypothetical protein
MPRAVAVSQEAWDIVQMTTWQLCGTVAYPEAMLNEYARMIDWNHRALRSFVEALILDTGTTRYSAVVLRAHDVGTTFTLRLIR